MEGGGSWALSWLTTAQLLALLPLRLVSADPSPQQIFHTPEGSVRLVGGKSEREGRVEILFAGEWGTVCDDDWTMAEASVVCKEQGFKLGALRAPTDAHFGLGPERMWLDNIGCLGDETRLADCPSNGLGLHDCSQTESAGVICKPNPLPKRPTTPRPSLRLALARSLQRQLDKRAQSISIKLVGGRNSREGRVQIRVYDSRGTVSKGSVCGTDFTAREALVVCGQLGLGFAEQSLTTTAFGIAHAGKTLLGGLRCAGNESRLQDCGVVALNGSASCDTAHGVAGVVCSPYVADLELDVGLLGSSLYLHDQALFYLQCAMEEGCLASSAEAQMKSYGGYWSLRRLLRFTTRTTNVGTADFRPNVPKGQWEWHQCHMHHHSMEVHTHAILSADLFDELKLAK